MTERIGVSSNGTRKPHGFGIVGAGVISSSRGKAPVYDPQAVSAES